MAKVVVIGVEGETGLWVADLDAGTVVPLDPLPTGDLKSVADLRAKGATVVKGVDFAVGVKSAQDVFSGVLDG